MRTTSILRSLFLCLPLLGSCAATSMAGDVEPPPTPSELARQAGVPLTQPPYQSVAMEWKERVVQPYVYFEHRGPEATFGTTMRALLEHAIRERVETNGPPFALYPQDGFARACLPVPENPGERGLPYDILPKAMVAYMVVSGPYDQVPHALPGLREAMATRGWADRGPVRAIYLVNPAEVETFGALATEVQIPWAITP